jgi:tetratricopeptide (TPR) repeat protein
MTAAEDYQEEMAALLGILAQPVEGLHLLEFATVPQLEDILAGVRPLCGTRPCLEVFYYPPREPPALLIERLRADTQALPPEPPPLIILRPAALPDVTSDGPAAQAFWKALNYRREALGDLHAQILLCVDPWHHAHLADVALDLLSWLMPRFHLIPPPETSGPRMEMLTGPLADVGLRDAAQAAESRWQTFWPILERLRQNGPLPSSAFRSHVLPLLESTLAAGNLVRARQVRDTASSTPIPPEDLIEWHKLNALLACGAGEASDAELHAEQLLKLMETPASESQAKKAGAALMKVANVLSASGLQDSAARFNKRLIHLFTTQLGPEHPNTLSCRNNLAAVLYSQGQYSAAEDEHRAVHKMRELIFGPDHPITLGSRNNLAAVLAAQRKHSDAAAEYRALLTIYERVLGSQHPDTLGIRNNLATALHSQGKYAESEAENRTVLALRESVLGPQHPDTLMSQMNLANSLRSQGKHAAAEAAYRTVLALQERVLGANHPDTLQNRMNLANSLGDQGKHTQAEAEHRAVLTSRERVLGAAHPDVFKSSYNLALNLESQGRESDAHDLAHRALAGFIKVFGDYHPYSQNAKKLVKRLEE